MVEKLIFIIIEGMSLLFLHTHDKCNNTAAVGCTGCCYTIIITIWSVHDKGLSINKKVFFRGGKVVEKYGKNALCVCIM